MRTTSEAATAGRKATASRRESQPTTGSGSSRTLNVVQLVGHGTLRIAAIVE